ncbi:PP2C family protein-serine/threonine phosphatase [Streptomyces sp. bgisy126]|uniref:PP2C family protein-serine/threonine phosphatase n=1 Tax=unclassified Streptomyces TaxID=2593676 RepID=UPI003EC11D5B
MRENIDEQPAVKTHGVARQTGDRVFQCDATAVCTMPDGTRAYALLDGVGDTPAVRAWTRTAARRLARAAAGHGDAEAGLRTEYGHYAADPARHDPDHDLPEAAAVVAVHVPDGSFSVAWSGDARAYLLFDGPGEPLRLLTDDHNARRACDGHGDRNLITACLGGVRDDEETERHWGHPAIEYMRGPARPGWLLLASDGTYEPHEDADHDLLDGYLSGDPREAAERLVNDAVQRAHTARNPYPDNATALITRLGRPE